VPCTGFATTAAWLNTVQNATVSKQQGDRQPLAVAFAQTQSELDSADNECMGSYTCCCQPISEAGNEPIQPIQHQFWRQETNQIQPKTALQWVQLTLSPALTVPLKTRPKASKVVQSCLGYSLAMCTSSGPLGLQSLMCPTISAL